MHYTKVNIEQWNRKQHFLFYRQTVPCGFSLTTQLDITALQTELRNKGHKLYPAMIHIIAQVVNQYPESRMAIKDNELILWDQVNPAYTVFHPETETFSQLWTEYDSDWSAFLANYQYDQRLYKDNIDLMAKPNLPENHFCISMIPWVSFDGFNLNVANFTDYFPPIFTLGKYYQSSEKCLLPLSIQVHHATIDGFHMARIVNQLQIRCDNFHA
ncbi:type A chloramphenicol O-acetyltransferase [Providencia manganoxydans]|uniref:Chloramphenicol acetyltransferase n=1 Tax=Providencia manganoxydans TaxID=2923283 RepID=A0ABX7AJ18_9GAMM|nr:type A chloramphenicol O-acetyltransferase [Providencia sp. PROV266]QQO63955.1 type A chloramphenicol O-acetyltransferase [Providencia manganoxydans]